MTINEAVNTALSAVLANSWADELPPEPTWPAIVFDIHSLLEPGWTTGAKYYQHVVTVVLLTKTLGERATLQPQIDTAMQALNVYLLEGDRGDAAYEQDPSVYGYFSEHTIRTRE